LKRFDRIFGIKRAGNNKILPDNLKTDSLVIEEDI